MQDAVMNNNVNNVGGVASVSVMEEEETIDLAHLLVVLWQNVWVILLVSFACAAIGFAYSRFMITPLYQSNVLMYVNNSKLSLGSTSVSIADLNASKSLVDTYAVIMKTRLTLNEVIEQADLYYTYEELYNMVTASAVNDTEIFRIVVTGPDPEETTLIANTVAQVLPDKISEVVDGSSVRTVDFAVVPSQKSSPSITRYTAIGMMLGFVACCGVIVLLDLLDDQVRDEEKLTKSYGLPMLAVIPDLYAKQSGKGYYGYGGYGSYGSSYSSSYAAAAQKGVSG